MDKTKILKREIFAQDVHVLTREDGTPSRTIRGCAIVFNTPSVPLYDYDGERGVEVIAPEAVTRELLDASDIKMTMFHDRQLILARSNCGNGTLHYDVTDAGVYFEFEAPNTVDGDKALELVSRGDIAGCSFAFSTHYYDDDCVSVSSAIEDEVIVKTYTVRSISRIHDFTLAADPAYPATTVDVRREAVPEGETDTDLQTNNPLLTMDEEKDKNEGTREQDSTQGNTRIERELGEIKTMLIKQQQKGSEQREASGLVMLREVARKKGRVDIVVREDDTSTVEPANNAFMVSGATEGGAVPVTIAEVLKPIRTGLIYDKVGINVRSGLSGEYVWPVPAAMQASVAGEDVELTDQKLTMSKLTAKPVRIGITTVATNQSIAQTRGMVESFLRGELPEAVAALINKGMFGSTALADDFKGPFVGKTAVSVSNYATILKTLCAPVYKKVGRGRNFAFVMDEATFATLKATSKDTGSGLMIIGDDGKLDGKPVFITEEIGAGKIGFGDFSQQMLGFFGQPRFVFDALTGATKDEVRLTLNMDVATKTLRADAFALATWTVS